MRGVDVRVVLKFLSVGVDEVLCQRCFRLDVECRLREVDAFHQFGVIFDNLARVKSRCRADRALEAFSPQMSECLDGLLSVTDDVRRCRVVGGEKIGRIRFPSIVVERHTTDDFASHCLLEDQTERGFDTTRLRGICSIDNHRGLVLVVIQKSAGPTALELVGGEDPEESPRVSGQARR